MNELHCDGVKLIFVTKQGNLEDAVRELERRLAMMSIDCELSGMMRLYDSADRLLEVC